MSLAKLIDTVTGWAEDNICSKILLKCPPENEDPNDAGYDFQQVHPAAFSLFMPGSDKLPPNVASPIPSVCVRLVDGEDDMTDRIHRTAELQLCLSTWDPGRHGKDMLTPVQKPDGTMSWRQAGTDSFDRTYDGWRGAVNFADLTLQELESVTQIGGYEIDRKTPIRFGLFKEQESIPDFYPLWYFWVGFRISTYQMLSNKDFDDYL